MLFYLDYCPYYYNDEIASSLNRKEEIRIFKDFIKYIQKEEKQRRKYNFYTSLRVLVNEFRNTLKEEDKDAFFNRVKQLIFESRFIDENICKYEVMIDYRSIREFKFIINEHIENMEEQEENEKSR